MAEAPRLRNSIPDSEGSDQPRKLPRLPRAPEDRFRCAWYGDDVRGSECVRRQCEASAQSDTPHCVGGKCTQGREVATRLGAEVPERGPAPRPRRYGLVEQAEPLRLAGLLRPESERRPPQAPSAVLAELALRGARPSAKAEERLRELPYKPAPAPANDTPRPAARSVPEASPVEPEPGTSEVCPAEVQTSAPLGEAPVKPAPTEEAPMAEETTGQTAMRFCVRCKEKPLRTNNRSRVCTPCRLALGNPDADQLRAKLQAEGVATEGPPGVVLPKPTVKPRGGRVAKKAARAAADRKASRDQIRAMLEHPEKVTINGVPLVRGARAGSAGQADLSAVPSEALLDELSRRLGRADVAVKAVREAAQVLAGAEVSHG